MAPKSRMVTRKKRNNNARDEEIHLEEDHVVHDINQENNAPDKVPKKTRGPTFKTDIWGRPRCKDRIKIEFDEMGEPVGKDAASFVEFLGTLVRNGKDVPIDIFDWRLVPEDKKLNLLEVVKNKFDIPFGTEHCILQSMGKKWRNFKAYLKDKYYDPDQPSLAHVAIVDERLVQEQWATLLTHWDTEKAKQRSEKNKQARACNKMNHCIGKKSYSRVRKEMTTQLGRPPSRVEMFKKCYTHSNGEPSGSEVASALGEMREHISQLPPGSIDTINPDDIFGQVMSKRSCSKVHKFGLSVPVTDKCSQLPSKSASYRIIHEQNKEMEKMKDKLKEQESKFEAQENRLQELTSKVMQLTNGSPNIVLSSSSSHAPSFATCPTPRTPMQPRHLTAHASVLIKSLDDPNKIVAKGYIVDMNPQKEVGGHVLGPNWCEVSIQVAVVREEHLVRPYSMLETIGDALGTNIAWPTFRVVRDEDF